MQNKSRRESIGQITNSIRSIVVDKADINIEGGWILIVVAYHINKVQGFDKLYTSMVKFIGLDMCYLDWYFYVVGLTRDVLVK